MSLSDIKKQITSISKTAQITHAMQLISTTKYNRIVNEAKKYQIYRDKVREQVVSMVHAFGDLHNAAGGERGRDPLIDFYDLLIERPVKKIGVIVVTSDQGLAGSYNSSLLKQLKKDLSSYDSDQVEIIAIGNAAVKFAKENDYHVCYVRNRLSSYPTFTEVRMIIRQSVAFYRDGLYDQLLICYNHAETILNVSYQYQPLLPLDSERLQMDLEHVPTTRVEYLVEPNIAEVLDQLLPLYVETQIYGALIDAKSAEYSSRMQAMQQATDNAHELIENLQQSYHQERQKRITNEIIEIINGANAQD